MKDPKSLGMIAAGVVTLIIIISVSVAVTNSDDDDDSSCRLKNFVKCRDFKDLSTDVPGGLSCCSRIDQNKLLYYDITGVNSAQPYTGPLFRWIPFAIPNVDQCGVFTPVGGQIDPNGDIEFQVTIDVSNVVSVDTIIYASGNPFRDFPPDQQCIGDPNPDADDRIRFELRIKFDT